VKPQAPRSGDKTEAEVFLVSLREKGREQEPAKGDDGDAGGAGNGGKKGA